MTNRDPGKPDDDDDGDAPDRRRGVMVLLFVLLLVIGGLVLVHILRNMSQIQDCVMSGRTNCAPLSP